VFLRGAITWKTTSYIYIAVKTSILHHLHLFCLTECDIPTVKEQVLHFVFYCVSSGRHKFMEASVGYSNRKGNVLNVHNNRRR
jgi:hypothetical protein